VLETERDEARKLLALMQSQPETEALEICGHIRTHSQDHDLSTLIRERVSVLEVGKTPINLRSRIKGC
jgi:hypothetical protein